LCSLGRRQVFDLLNDFLCVHALIIHNNPLWASRASAQGWYSHRRST
jgi:hypothetical protein